MGNDLKFDYTPYTKQILRLFLDALHGLKVDNIELVDALELMRFLCYEGKTGQFIPCQITCKYILLSTEKLLQKRQSLRSSFTRIY